MSLRTIDILAAAGLAPRLLELERARGERQAAAAQGVSGAIGALAPLVGTTLEKGGTVLQQQADEQAMNAAKGVLSGNVGKAGARVEGPLLPGQAPMYAETEGEMARRAVEGSDVLKGPQKTGDWWQDFTADPFGMKARSAERARAYALEEAAKQVKAARGEAEGREEKQFARSAEQQRFDIQREDIKERDKYQREKDEADQVFREQQAKEARERWLSEQKARAKELWTRIQEARANREDAQAARKELAEVQAGIRAAEIQGKADEKRTQMLTDLDYQKGVVDQNAAELIDTIKKVGVNEAFGPETGIMEGNITEIATALAKLSDPNSAALPGEVEKYKRILIAPNSTEGFLTSKDTAVARIEHAKKLAETRLQERRKALGLVAPQATQQPPGAAPAAGADRVAPPTLFSR
jgi:hypothetical protein